MMDQQIEKHVEAALTLAREFEKTALGVFVRNVSFLMDRGRQAIENAESMMVPLPEESDDQGIEVDGIVIRLLRNRDVCEELSISNKTLGRLVKSDYDAFGPSNKRKGRLARWTAGKVAKMQERLNE